jgi:hypothetical protein
VGSPELADCYHINHLLCVKSAPRLNTRNRSAAVKQCSPVAATIRDAAIRPVASGGRRSPPRSLGATSCSGLGIEDGQLSQRVDVRSGYTTWRTGATFGSREAAKARSVGTWCFCSPPCIDCEVITALSKSLRNPERALSWRHDRPTNHQLAFANLAISGGVVQRGMLTDQSSAGEFPALQCDAERLDRLARRVAGDPAHLWRANETNACASSSST